jgi:hypothetical protein
LFVGEAEGDPLGEVTLPNTEPEPDRDDPLAVAVVVLTEIPEDWPAVVTWREVRIVLLGIPTLYVTVDTEVAEAEVDVAGLELGVEMMLTLKGNELRVMRRVSTRIQPDRRRTYIGGLGVAGNEDGPSESPTLLVTGSVTLCC